MDRPTKHERKQDKPWFAPKIKQKSDKSLKPNYQKPETPSGYNLVDEQFLQEKALKRHHRVGYAQRQQDTLPSGRKNTSEVSPTLDLKTGDQTISERLRMYSRNHKCHCGRQFNDWTVEKERYLVPRCDHMYERPMRPTQHKCIACQAHLTQYERYCLCYTYVCTRCKRGYYEQEDTPITSWPAYCQHQGKMRSIVETNDEWYAETHGKKLFEKDGFTWERHDHGTSLELPKHTKPKTFADALKDVTQGGEEDITQGGLMDLFNAATGMATSIAQKVIDMISSLATSIRKQLIDTLKSSRKALSIAGSLVTGMQFLTSLMQRTSRYLRLLTPSEVVLSISGLLSSDNKTKFVTVIALLLKAISAYDWDDCQDELEELMLQEDPTILREASMTYSSLLESQNRDQTQGCADLLEIFSSSLTTQLGKGLFKSLAYFCKEVSPIIALAKNSIDLTDRVKDILTRMFGFWAKDSKSWLAYQLKAPSPIRSLFETVLLIIRSYVREEGERIIELKKRYKTQKETAMENARKSGYLDYHLLQFFEQLDKIVAKPNLSGTRRHEPFVIRLYGAPGVGKSTGVPLLLAPILGCKTKTEYDSMVFCRGMSEYWDGVGNKKVIVYDDFGQDISEEADLREFITLVSDNAFMANFSGLDPKCPKGTIISPEIVVCCSNTSKEDPKTIKSQEALERRFHLKLEVKRCPTTKSTLFRFEVRNDIFKPSFRIEDGWYTIHETADYLYTLYAEFLINRDSAVQEKEMVMTQLEYKPLIGDRNTVLNAAKDETKNGRVPFYPLRNQPQSGFMNTDERVRRDLAVASLRNPQQRTGKPIYPNPLDIVNARLKHYNSEQQPTTSQAAHESRPDMTQGEDDDCFTSAAIDAIFGATVETAYVFYVISLAAGIATYIRWLMQEQSTLFDKILRGLLTAAVPVVCIAIYAVANYAFSKQDRTESSTHKYRPPKVVVTDTTQGQQADNIGAIVMANTVRISREGYGGLNCVFIQDTCILLPMHFFVDQNGIRGNVIPAGTQLTILSPNSDSLTEFPFQPERLHRFGPHVDAAVYVLPRDLFAPRRRITQHFWHGDYVLNDVPVQLIDYRNTTRSYVLVNCRTREMLAYSYAHGKTEFAQTSFKVDFEGRTGACGSLYLDQRNSSPHPIIGFHAAYSPSNRCSIGVVITQRMINSLNLSRGVEPPTLSHPIFDDRNIETEGGELVHGQMEVVGTLRRTLYSPTKTQQEESSLYDKIVPHTIIVTGKQ